MESLILVDHRTIQLSCWDYIYKVYVVVYCRSEVVDAVVVGSVGAMV